MSFQKYYDLLQKKPRITRRDVKPEHIEDPITKPMDKPKETPKRKKSKQPTKEETTRNFLIFFISLFKFFFFFKLEGKGIESDSQEIGEKAENEEENLEKQRGSFDSKTSEPGVEKKEKQTPSEKGEKTPYKRSVKKQKDTENKNFEVEEKKEKQRAEEKEIGSKDEGEIKKGRPNLKSSLILSEICFFFQKKNKANYHFKMKLNPREKF